jgi:hypothetical protein
MRLLDRFVREVTGTPVILVGNSMGGLISVLQTWTGTSPRTHRNPQHGAQRHGRRGLDLVHRAPVTAGRLRAPVSAWRRHGP